MSVITANAQSYTANLEFYVGTWRYTNASTGEEFTIPSDIVLIRVQ